MIKAVIFDFAGVIGTDGYWIWLRKVIKDIEQKKDYFQKISEEVDRVEIPHEEFMNALAKASGKTPEQVWSEVKKEIIINKPLLETIKRLKKNYKLGLLTNYTYPWFKELLEENNLSELFDVQLISSLHKVIKPDPEAFRKILQMLGVTAEEAIFIDDRQMNIDGATKVNLKGILYATNEGMVQKLKEAGIEI